MKLTKNPDRRHCLYCEEGLPDGSQSSVSVDKGRFSLFCESCGWGRLRDHRPRVGFCTDELPRMHQEILNRFMQIVEVRCDVSNWSQMAIGNFVGAPTINCMAPCLLDSESGASEILKLRDSELVDLHMAHGDALIVTTMYEPTNDLPLEDFTAVFSTGLVRSGTVDYGDHLDTLGYLCEDEAALNNPDTEFRHDFDCWEIQERRETDLFSNLLTDPFAVFENPDIIEHLGKILFTDGFTVHRGDYELIAPFVMEAFPGKLP